MRILDGCCKEGGAGYGYHLAGFEVVGVDCRPQPRYPFTFIQDDIVRFIRAHGHEFDAIHVSPPCQAYSNATSEWRRKGYEYPDLVYGVREALLETHKPYIIENVMGAPLIEPVMLCGLMFGLHTFRHRLFEANFPLRVPTHPTFHPKLVKMGRPIHDGDYVSLAGHFSGAAYARKVMETPWMSIAGMAEAIPPAYSEHIGKQLLAHLEAQRSL